MTALFSDQVRARVRIICDERGVSQASIARDAGMTAPKLCAFLRGAQLHGATFDRVVDGETLEEPRAAAGGPRIASRA